MAEDVTARERSGPKGETCEGGRPGQPLNHERRASEAPWFVFSGVPMACNGGAELMPLSASEACPQARSLMGAGDEERHPWSCME